MSNTTATLPVSTAVKVQNRSGFDCSHIHLTTGEVGELVPVLCDEILPNTTINLGCLANIQLPPLATPFRGKVDGRIEAFFVPSRLLWSGWKDFISKQNQTSPTGNYPVSVPRVNILGSDDADKEFLSYFGVNNFAVEGPSKDISVLPFVAYCKIWDDWYRDARIQNSCFDSEGNNALQTLPYRLHSTGSMSPFGHDAPLFNGHKILRTFQRNYARDYYTAAQTQSTIGTDLGVTISNLGEGFTIPDLRNLNALQRFNETLASAGNRYEDVVKAMYGVRPSDEVLNKAYYLGGLTIDLNPRSVTNSQGNPIDPTEYDRQVSNVNPYIGIGGSQYGVSEGVNGNSLCKDFHTTEQGYLFVIASVVPHAFYQSGNNRMFSHLTVADFGNGILSGVGVQPIFASELSNVAMPSNIFAYNDRFSEYKYINDHVSGNFQSGKSLSMFALKRPVFGGSAVLNSSFITIPVTALDEVRAVVAQDDVSAIQFDFAFKYFKVQPLPSYSIPTLGLPEDTHTEFIATGGTRL